MAVTIGTHSGTFQADEAMGVWLLRQLPQLRFQLLQRLAVFVLATVALEERHGRVSHEQHIDGTARGEDVGDIIGKRFSH